MHRWQALVLLICTYLLLAWRAAASPLQWERMMPLGEGPSPRHGHASASLDSAQSVYLVFGGDIGYGQVSSEVWAFDLYSRRWEQLNFQDRTLFCGEVVISTADMPSARAGHAMARQAPPLQYDDTFFPRRNNRLVAGTGA
eukprot:2516739-Rhodomonas_salina.1